MDGELRELLWKLREVVVAQAFGLMIAARNVAVLFGSRVADPSELVGAV